MVGAMRQRPGQAVGRTLGLSSVYTHCQCPSRREALSLKMDLLASSPGCAYTRVGKQCAGIVRKTVLPFLFDLRDSNDLQL